MVTDSPYKPPESVLVEKYHGEVYRKGKYVVHDPAADLPSRCFKCNAETSVTKKLKMTYVNHWFYLSILVTFLLTIILVLIFQKKFRKR